MKTLSSFLIGIGASLLIVLPAQGQAAREDVIWARRSLSFITLDGVLNENAWAVAESMIVEFPQDTGIPGSGWKYEAGQQPISPTYAVLKFLTFEGQLYLGARVSDQSVGGSATWERFDGFLMSIKDHLSENAPKPPTEYFYSWWYAESEDPQPPGQEPAFVGRFGSWPPGTPRTEEAIAAWDARTIVDGLSNDDAVVDEGYTVEMRFDLEVLGYDVERSDGDIIEWNISIYDCDWFWPINGPIFSSNRVWWQSPWGNDDWYSEVRIHARPSVHTGSGPVPEIGPEMRVAHGNDFAAPVIDGQLNENVWIYAPYFWIRYDDEELRKTYPAVGPYRAGQYQPPVNGGEAFVLDPANAQVKMFFRDHYLYLGFDVFDQVVQYHANFDRWDGFIVVVTDVVLRHDDNNLLDRRLAFQVAPDGSYMAHDYLATLLDEGGAEISLALKAGTTVDTLGLQADTGYKVELKIDLTKLSYPADLGDGTLHIGIDHLDGDSFIPITDSYGTRTWWFRERQNECCPVWAYMDPGLSVADVSEPGDRFASRVSNYPNPSSATTIEYVLAERARVGLEVYDVQGRLVRETDLGIQPAGTRQIDFDARDLGQGIYLYRVKIMDPFDGAVRSLRTGRMVTVR